MNINLIYENSNSNKVADKIRVLVNSYVEDIKRLVGFVIDIFNIVKKDLNFHTDFYV